MMALAWRDERCCLMLLLTLCVFVLVGYRHLPGPAGRGRALVDGAPWQTAAVPRDPGVSC